MFPEENMRTRTFKFAASCLVLALAAFACGGGGGENASQPQEMAAQAAPAQSEAKAELTPTEIGQQVGDLYVQAMSDLVTTLKDKPAAAEVQGKIASMREEYIQKLVKLGHSREALDESERSQVDLQIRLKTNSVSKEDFALFNDIQQHYFSERDFHKIIMSFNIITQYASFDLLKKQEPEEAVRLGIQ